MVDLRIGQYVSLYIFSSGRRCPSAIIDQVWDPDFERPNDPHHRMEAVARTGPSIVRILSYSQHDNAFEIPPKCPATIRQLVAQHLILEGPAIR